jgi:carbamoyltransferase
VNDQELFDQVSDLVLENKVIGWMRDGGEIGPRALGNRSIVANPSCPWMVEYINSEIKHREWYRPFAPAVLYDHQQEIFDLDYFSPYMLLTTNVKNDWSKAIPAVTHYDGTSRVQSVSKEINPAFYGLISAFYRKSGIPILLNTSFNGKGEPMVETPEDAINTLLSTQLYAVVINNFLVTKYQ